MAIEKKPIGTDRYYKDVMYRVHNALVDLTYEPNGNPMRNQNLSDLAVQNIELRPVIIDKPMGMAPGSTTTIERGEDILAPSIYLSVDSFSGLNEEPGTYNEFIEIVNIRIELYVGVDDDNYQLSEKSMELIQDVHEVLKPTDFIGAPFYSEQYLSRTAVMGHNLRTSIELGSSIDFEKDVSLIVNVENPFLSGSKDGHIRVTGENLSGAQFVEYFLYKSGALDRQVSKLKFAKIHSIEIDGFSDGTLDISAPLTDRTRSASISNAEIVAGFFDERTRGSPEEIIQFVFEVELRHFIDSCPRTENNVIISD